MTESGGIIDFNFAKLQSELGKASLDVGDIRERLNASARSFVEWLFSGRALITRGGHEARIGDVDGNVGTSLSIHLTGSNTGLWKDHATSESGDLITLYRMYMGYGESKDDFKQAIKEIAKDFLHDPIEVERPTFRPTPEMVIRSKKEKFGTKPRDDDVELGAPVATFKYFNTRGEITASVVRYEPDGTRASKTFRPFCYRDFDGKKRWAAGAPDIRPLYRLPEISLSGSVILVEGEGKADALARLGIEATSAMQGANAPIDKTDWSPLAGKRVTIWPDNDQPGFDYANTVAKRLLQLNCTVYGINPPADAPIAWDAADCIAEGRDPHELINAAVLYSGQDDIRTRVRIRIIDIDDLENLPAPQFLIDNVITEGGLSVLWGPPGAMKSFVALDMGLCVGTGYLWHGKTTRLGTVVYLAAEGAHGLGQRAVGWRNIRGKGLAKPKFKIIPHSIAMTGVDDLNALIEAILKLDELPILIIIDTLARTFGAGNENQQSDMNAYVNAADKLREATGAHVMIVHHSGVHEVNRERGSNVLRGAADTVIKVARKGNKIDIVNRAPAGKQKDFEEFDTVKLRAVIEHWQTGENGEVDHSTVILTLREDGDKEVDMDQEPKTETAQETKSRVTGKNQKLVLSALKASAEPLTATTLILRTGLDKNRMYEVLNDLVEKGLVACEDSADGNAALWNITDEGRDVL
ncbi:AAA family ATPase [Bradyrhizobium elkanii]|uniref:AAA family ATPase n=1 Tax=Bradyrhizobium elkanii TaxID=29448 RepID=UPI0003FA3298|nr:AAA family ATPase [Bradyrhizobium elkanii]